MADAGSEVEHKWCESMSLAGRYTRKGGDGSMVSLTLESYTAEETSVSLEPEPAGFQGCLFSLKTGKLHAKGEDGAVGEELASINHIGGLISWVAAAPWGEETWEFAEKVPEHSLTIRISEDEALLAALSDAGDPIDFTASPFRKLTEAEWQGALAACRVIGSSAAPAREAPKALYVMAPSAGGKTSVCTKFAASYGINLDEAVRADGAMFREYHKQYDLVCENGKANNGLWYNAWSAAKKVVQNSKKDVIRQAVENKQDLVISDTGSDTAASAAKLMADGYSTHVLGIHADPKEICARGVARELGEGKRYNRNLKKIVQTFDMFAPAIQAINGEYKIVLNSTGREPVAQLEGTGCSGGDLPEGLVDRIREFTRASETA
eukprot:TRINITY_DN40848_c0_g1_i1.p1 TRINITY_DN40848_c0_g1~~TRINITY_DN40848_c0_g1_i1.p1  ORF type:complete len:379 (+),score=72.17 TRINITY_DN40848_c0_g1_i1:49-1185(+)